MTRDWYWATTSYTTAAEVSYLQRLFSEPPAIVAACNKVNRRIERSLQREWWKGIACAVSAVLVACCAVWGMMR
jgi:hypothetical protein